MGTPREGSPSSGAAEIRPRLGLSAHQAATGGRGADGAAAVVAVGDGEHAARDRRGRAAGGAARRTFQVLQTPRDVVVVLAHVLGHQRAAVREAQALHRPVVLIAVGTPANGRSSPGCTASAAASARSASTSTNALRAGFSSSILSSETSTSSRAETSPERTISASSVAGRNIRSLRTRLLLRDDGSAAPARTRAARVEPTRAGIPATIWVAHKAAGRAGP